MTRENDPGDVVAQQLRASRILPVLVIRDVDQAVAIGEALMSGGIGCAEVTFRTAHAAESIRRMREAIPDLLIGAGTVLDVGQALAAEEAGAAFVVSPGFTPRVVEHCLSRGMAVFPGICTPTELGAAVDAGVTAVKFFPAEQAGGIGFLKAIAAPFADVDFIPTGGIDETNVASYLAFDRVIACGGSWIVRPEWIASRRFDLIRDAAARACQLARFKEPS